MGILVGIPTYFGNVMVQNCLASLLKEAKNPNSFKTIIYKNDVGWLKASNEIMRLTSDDILLLNDDTLIVSDIVSEMSLLAYSDPKIGIIGGKALEPTGYYVVNYGIYLGPDGNTAHKHYGKSKQELTKVETQKAVEGSCIYIKREVIDKVGMFDEGYGMGYREEVDLCLRAREAGYKVVSCPTAEYVHYISQTNAQLNIKNETYDYFMSKWSRKLALGLI